MCFARGRPNSPSVASSSARWQRLRYGHIYKAVLNPTGEKANKSRLNDSIRKTACSMANTDGGYILFGILDQKQSGNTTEERIKGIPCSGDMLKEFGDKLLGVQPEIHFTASSTPIRLPETPDQGIFVVHIPRSPRRPHMDETSHIFYRRGHGGACPANSGVTHMWDIVVPSSLAPTACLYASRLLYYATPIPRFSRVDVRDYGDARGCVERDHDYRGG
jgi:hypothetical protein